MSCWSTACTHDGGLHARGIFAFWSLKHRKLKLQAPCSNHNGDIYFGEGDKSVQNTPYEILSQSNYCLKEKNTVQ